MVNASSTSNGSSSFHIPEQYGNFKRSAGPVNLQESYNQPIQIVKYTSEKTGLRVVLIDVEGPLCNLYASVATEIFTDAGCPHTLEHLVFLGSEKYPYKGVLDSLANRAFAQGTNAWTDQTNTTYTITTAGEEGFLRILPIYIDHMLYPTLTEAGFTTEVYHINGKAEDAGVVYSEMQGRENLPFSVMALKQQRALYPEGSGYRSETGGLMDALRVLNIDQIRDYHSTYYSPHNLCLFATGKIEPEKLLKVLQEEVEPSIEKHKQAHGPRPDGWKRPFVETPSAKAPKLEKDRVEVAEFPEKDESMGEVSISWVGAPSNDFLTEKAIDILNSYLTDSAISPLQKALVEIEDPYATDLGFDISDQLTTVLNLGLSSVPTEKLNEVAPKVKEVLAGIVEAGVDMKRMEMILNREQRKLLSTIEKDASEALTISLLSDFLFNKEDGTDLPESLNDIKRFKELKAWSAGQWCDVLRKYYVDNNSLTVIGKPSASLAEKLAKEGADRVAATKARLGADGLKKMEEKLKHAQEENDREVPPDMLSSFKIPDVKSIRWIDVKSASGGINKATYDNEVQKHVQSDKADVPYFMQFEHIKSNFIEVCIYFNAANLAANRSLLNLYTNTFHSLPITRADGTTLTFEQVVEQLDTESVDYSINFGSGLSEQVEMNIKVEKGNYETAIAWLRDLLFGSEFDVGRLRIVANKLTSNLPSEKREGNGVAASVFRQMTQDATKSAASALNLLDRLESSPALVQRLKDEPEKVVKEMQELREVLTSPKNMRIAVSGDILDIAQPLSAWNTHFRSTKGEKLQPVTYARDLLSDLGRKPSRKATVVPLPSIESSFSYHVAKGPNSYEHPDLPAIMVARSAINALEGILWKSVRGAGLAYGTDIMSDTERGLTYLRVYRSPDCAAAFVKARESMQAMIDGKLMPLDDLMLEAAKSSLAFTTANQMSTLSDAAESSFINQVLKDVPQSYQRDLLEKAGRVTVEEANAAVKNWLMPIFDPATSVAAIATAKSKSEDITKQLTELGYEVKTLEITKPDEEDDGMSEDEQSGSESESGSDDMKA